VREMRYRPTTPILARRYVANLRNDEQEAAQIRETFVDRPVENIEQVHWKWPRQLVEVGQCVSVMYSSDKWQPRRGDLVDYKHVSEGQQRVSVVPGFLRDFDRDPSARMELEVEGTMVEVDGPMPDSFAVLAPLLGFQVRLYERGGDGDLLLPNGDEGVYQVDTDPRRVSLGAAKHPGTGETFLIVYDKSKLLGIVTGDILDVEKDGIVG